MLQDNNNPLVSIVISTHNRPLLLQEALQSVLNQTYQNIEIWVIDDETPGHENGEYCNNYKNVNYLKIHSTGTQSNPRNVGASLANGKYLGFLDDDDNYEPQKIEKQVAILEANPAYGLIHGPCKVMNNQGEVTGKIIGKTRNPNEKHGKLFPKMVGRWGILMPSPLMLRSLFLKVGGFRTTLHGTIQDTDLWTRLSIYTDFFYLEEPLVVYREHTENRTTHYKTDKPQAPVKLYAGMIDEYVRGGIDKRSFRIVRKQLLYALLRHSHKIGGNTLRAYIQIIDPLYFIRLRFMYNLVKRKLNL